MWRLVGEARLGGGCKCGQIPSWFARQPVGALGRPRRQLEMKGAQSAMETHPSAILNRCGRRVSVMARGIVLRE